MLDLAGIIFSSVMMMIVVVNAVRLDRIQPWFSTARKKAAGTAGPAGKPWQRARPH
jgi:hypothetical protein